MIVLNFKVLLLLVYFKAVPVQDQITVGRGSAYDLRGECIISASGFIYV